MIKLDELQKALDEVEAIVWATCEFGSLGREKMNVLLYQFSMFKDEYVGQVHVPLKDLEELKKQDDAMVHVSRKQLSELIDTMPHPKDDQYFAHNGLFMNCYFDPDLETWKIKLKKLLEAK